VLARKLSHPWDLVLFFENRCWHGSRTQGVYISAI